MLEQLLKKIKDLPRLRLLIILFTVWQYFCVAGIALLGWSPSLIWTNLGLLLTFIFTCPVYESLLLLILSIPFYVVIPNNHFDGLSMWRVLFLALFAVWLVRDNKFKLKSIIFMPWDKYLAYFCLVGLALVFIFGRFRVEGIKQFVFWLNVYFLYFVTINTIKSKKQILEIVRYLIWSLAIIITIGFTQLISTFFSDLEVFWVFWASNISKLYYGQNFASVALYSNSWFSYTGGLRELRMFSIMPDSQSFAYICIFGLCIGTALTKSVFTHIKKWLWSGIRCAGLALILSGTRAVWVGMILPFAAAFFAYYKNFHKRLAKKFLIPFLIIFLLFAASPFFNQALSYLAIHGFKENFMSRAESIYNPKETSNQGRIIMWINSGEFFLRHPFGIGFGNFIVSFNPGATGSYDQVSSQVNKRYNLPAKYVSAHSLYLQVLVETGLIGFCLFAAFWFTVTKYFYNFIKTHQNTEDFLIYFVAQALLSVLWVLAAAVFDITIFNDRVLMFFLLNIGLAGVIVSRYSTLESAQGIG